MAYPDCLLTKISLKKVGRGLFELSTMSDGSTARKLLVVIWHVLTARTADQQADPKAVARRLFRWGAAHHLATRAGLSRSAFVRGYLDDLGVGEELTHFAINGRTIVLKASG